MIKIFTDWLVYSFLGLDQATKLGSSVNFFVYDTLKISVMILVVITGIAFIRTFFPPNKLKDTLSKQKFGLGNVSASLLGAVTPFCSCSSIPMFIGFLEAGVPLGIALSFIITSPLVNEVLLVLMAGTFGWEVAILYALFGIILGVAAGLILGRMNIEKEIILKLGDNQGKKIVLKSMPKDMPEKIKYSFQEGWGTFKQL